MELRLGGKRALITGSGTGIGAAIAGRLAAEGAAVLVHGRRTAAVDKLVDQIAAAGGQATGVLGDLTTETGVGKVVAAALGSGEATAPFPTMPDYAATKAALVNLSVSLAKHLARTGITVNTVSPGIVVTDGVERFYRQVAAERGWGDEWAEIEAGVLREVLDNPTGRLGRPEDVADLVAYLVSPLAGYVNGANLRVDGGSTPCVN